MKKLFTLSFVLLFFSLISGETLYYYVEGKKVELSEDFSSYSFIRTTLTKANFTLPQNVNVIKKHDNVLIIKTDDASAKLNLAKNGALFPAYIKDGVKVHVGGRIFVKIPGKPDVENAEKWCKKNGLTFVTKYKYAYGWYLVSTEGNPIKKAAELVESKIAEAAEPSFFIPVRKRSYIPNDPLFKNQWHLLNDSSNTSVSGSDHAHVAEAWEVLKAFKGNIGGNGIKLAIVDDGFDLDHEDLAGRFTGGYDFKDDDTDPTYNPNKQYPDEHGTACAGVAGAATDNGKGVSGACPNCTLIPIRIDLDGDTPMDESAIKSFEWAANAGADIISNSWGPVDNQGAADMSTALKQTVAKLTTEGRNGKGIIILFAAGNGDEDIDGQKTKDGFAGNTNVFAIGATNADGTRAKYSDYGKSLDFMAPSQDFEECEMTYDKYYGYYLACSDDFDGIWTVDNTGYDGYNQSDDGQLGGRCSQRIPCGSGLTCSSNKCVGNENAFTGSYRDYSNDFGGTSSACPLAAGITGLVLSANPELTRDDVYEIYKTTSDKVGGANNYSNGFSQYYGYGRINACEAVKTALDLAGKDISQVTCGGEVINPDPIDDTDTGDTSDSGDSTDTSDTANTADTGDSADSADTADTADTGTVDPADPADSSDTSDSGTPADNGNEICGNGLVEGNEQCDDGNTVSGDGCSKYCMFENKISIKSSDGCSIIVL